MIARNTSDQPPSPPIPLGQHDDMPLFEIRPIRWGELLTFTHPDVQQRQLSTKATEGDAVALLNTLLPHSAALQELVHVVHSLKSSKAADLLEARCRHHQVDTNEGFADADADQETAAEFAARIWMRSKADELAQKALEEAMVLIDAPEEKRYQRFVGKGARQLTWNETHRSTVKTATATYLAKNKLVPYVECTAVVDKSTGDVIVKVVHGQRPHAILHVTATSTKVVRVNPATCDIVKYIPSKGQLLISALSAPAVKHYLSLMGAMFFNDTSFFSSEPILRLRKLLDEDALQAACTGIPFLRRVQLTEISLIDEEGTEVTLKKGRHVWAHLRSRGYRSSARTILSGGLRLFFMGAKGADVEFMVRLRGSRGVSMDTASPFEPRAEQFLWNSGIYHKPDDRPEGDWWEYQPWTMSISEWQQVLRGKSPEPYISQKILTACDLDAIRIVGDAHIPTPVQRLGQDTTVVLTPDGLSHRTLTSTDLMGYRWNPLEQAKVLAGQLHTKGSVTPRETLGAIDLGWLDCEGTSIQVILITRELEETGTELAQLSAHATALGRLAVGIVPEGRASASAALRLVSWRLPDVEGNGLLRHLLCELGLEGTVSPFLTAPPSAEVILDRRDPITSSRVWWKEPRLTMSLSDQALRALICLAEAYPNCVSAETIKEFCHAERTGALVVRALRNELTRTEGFTHNPAKVIETVHGEGYRLTANPYLRKMSKGNG